MEFYSNSFWSKSLHITTNGDSSNCFLSPCESEFLRFLAIAQFVGADFLFFDWHENALSNVGWGQTGKINQSPLNSQASFAFKTFRRTCDPSQEAEVYRTLTNELLVLQHPSIRGHPNFVRLYGISFDVVFSDDTNAVPRIWPVFVLEKSSHGDLDSFITNHALNLHQVLALCVQIGAALEVMHASDIVHGDLKPQNVLVNLSPSSLEAKVIDFGYSCYGCSESALIFPQGTRVWSAPEWHHRGFTLSEAKTMDVYSYGKICAWIGLRGRTAPATLSRLDVSSICEGVFHEYEAEARSAASGLDLLQNLVSFLEQALEVDPGNRKSNVASLLDCLDTSARSLPDAFDSRRLSDGQIRRRLPQVPVISDDFEEFQSCHFLVRTQLVQDLTFKANTKSGITSKQAAFELALCYLLAFGVERDILSSNEWLERSGRTSDDLAKEVAKAKERRDYHGPLRDAALSKHIDYNPGEVYRRTGLLPRAIEVLRFEVAGKVGSEVVHSLLHLKAHLAHLLSHSGYAEDLEEQKTLREDIFSLTEKICGPEHLNTLLAMSSLGRCMKANGKLAEAEKLQRTVLKFRVSAHEVDHPDILKAMDDLAVTLTWRGETTEAMRLLEHTRDTYLIIFGALNPRTIASTRHLARVMSARGDLVTAERLCKSAVETSRGFYWEGHEDVIKTQEDLSEILLKKGKVDEALLAFESSLEMKMKFHGEDHQQVSDHMRRHVDRFRRNGRTQEVIAMQRNILERSRLRYGQMHVTTAWDLQRLGIMLHECGAYSEAAGIYAEIWEVRKALLGPDHEETISASRCRAVLMEKAG